MGLVAVHVELLQHHSALHLSTTRMVFRENTVVTHTVPQ